MTSSNGTSGAGGGPPSPPLDLEQIAQGLARSCMLDEVVALHCPTTHEAFCLLASDRIGGVLRCESSRTTPDGASLDLVAVNPRQGGPPVRVTVLGPVAFPSDLRARQEITRSGGPMLHCDRRGRTV